MVRFEAAAAAEEQNPPRLAASAARLGFSSPSGAPHPPRVPDLASRLGHGPALRPRALCLLSGAGGRCGGQEAGEAGGGEESSASGAEKGARAPRPAPRARFPVSAALARAARSPDEPRWPGLNPECTPCNSSPCACPTASRRASNSSSGMM